MPFYKPGASEAGLKRVLKTFNEQVGFAYPTPLYLVDGNAIPSIESTVRYRTLVSTKSRLALAQLLVRRCVVERGAMGVSLTYHGFVQRKVKARERKISKGCEGCRAEQISKFGDTSFFVLYNTVSGGILSLSAA